MSRLQIATRDYARPQRPKSGPPPKGRTGARKTAHKRGASSNTAASLPLWAWMVVSFSLLVLAAVIYVVSQPVDPMDMSPSSLAKAKKGDKVIEIPPKEPERFGFYEMLPSYEVVVSEEVLNPAKRKPGSNANNLPPRAVQPVSATTEAASAAAVLAGEKPTAAATTVVPAELPQPAAKPLTISTSREPTTPPSKPAAAQPLPPQPTAQLAKGEQFLIQVAAFRTRADAEQRIAALTLAGLSGRVEQVTIDNKDTWYRVRLGPYHSAAAASAAQQNLKAQGFNGVVMKVRS